MSQRLISLEMVLGLLLASARAQEPKDPFEQAPAGKVSVQETDNGILVVSNVPDNRYTYRLTGMKVSQVQYENKENPHARIWAVDDIIIQLVPVPLVPEGDLGYSESVLLNHQKYENDHLAEGGYREVDSARKWLRLPNGPGLFWELLPSAEAKEQDRPKMLFATAVNGRYVLMFSVSVLPGVDEAKAKKLLLDTIQTLQPKEKLVTRVVNPGNATMLLLNDELASREDRKAPGAWVVKPEEFMLLARLALEVNSDPGGYMTAIHDGKSAHMITLLKYKPDTKRFVYDDTLGKQSFLTEGNNRAGVKAEAVPDEGLFSVSEDELQTVIQAIISLPFSAARPYFATATLDDAVSEYRLLRKLYPDSREVTEASLLKAARILAESKQESRAVNVYAACRALHEHSARALAGIAEVFAQTGQTQPAINFFGDAIQELSADKSLDIAEARRLAAAWIETREALMATPKK